jgi:hypothetical protein
MGGCYAREKVLDFRLQVEWQAKFAYLPLSESWGRIILRDVAKEKSKEDPLAFS